MIGPPPPGSPPPPEVEGTLIDVQMLVLLVGLGSGSVAAFWLADTVTQLPKRPPFGTVKENKAVPDSPGCRDLLAVHEIGSTGPAPSAHDMGRDPPPPVYVEPAGALGVSTRVSGATDGTPPMLVTVTVHSTDCGPLTAHALTTLRSGPLVGCAEAAMAANNVAALASSKNFRERAANEPCVVESFIFYPLVIRSRRTRARRVGKLYCRFQRPEYRRRYSLT